ncbi:hypothetical protein DM02DRAFT_681089, partial [Periconia macrospinosa]
ANQKKKTIFYLRTSFYKLQNTPLFSHHLFSLIPQKENTSHKQNKARQAMKWPPTTTTTLLLPLLLTSPPTPTTAFNFSAYTSPTSSPQPFSVYKPSLKLSDGCQPFAPFPDMQSMTLQWQRPRGQQAHARARARARRSSRARLLLGRLAGDVWVGKMSASRAFNGGEAYSVRVFDPEELDVGKEGQEERYKCEECRGEKCLDGGF